VEKSCFCRLCLFFSSFFYGADPGESGESPGKEEMEKRFHQRHWWNTFLFLWNVRQFWGRKMGGFPPKTITFPQSNCGECEKLFYYLLLLMMFFSISSAMALTFGSVSKRLLMVCSEYTMVEWSRPPNSSPMASCDIWVSLCTR